MTEFKSRQEEKEPFEITNELTKKRLQQRRKQRKKQLALHVLLCSAVIIILISVVILVLSAVTGTGVFGEEDKGFSKYIETPPTYTQQFLTVNEYSRPGTPLEQVNGIVIHYTGNPGTTAQQNRSYFEGLAESKITKASSHFIIGLSGEIIMCIPLEEIAYASNERNADTIAIECCIDNEEGRFTEKTYDALVELTAWLVGKYDLTMDDVIRHYDVTGKQCPKYFVEHESAWDDFKLDVAKYIETYGIDKDRKEEYFLDRILKQLENKENLRSNLSELRQKIKEQSEKEKLLSWIPKQEFLVFDFLQEEDAKTRKNAALLLGDLGYQNALDALYAAYQAENTLFVKASYLQALEQLDVSEILPDLKGKLETLLASEVEPENKKHVEEELRALRKIIIKYEGITHHTADIKDKQVTVILLTNRTQRETVRRMVTCGEASVHPLGVLVKTDNLKELMKIRTFRDMVFPLDLDGFIPAEPAETAKAIWESDIIGLLDHLHKEKGNYFFRIECKNAMTLEERSAFTKKLASELESLSNGNLINSTSDYEVELRLIANKEGELFPCIKLSTIKKRRFTYRKNAIAASIHPSTAALIVELAKDYLKEDAQIIDPFCGVGTMLIERNKKIPAREMYGIDIFGDAITYARENTQLAGMRINYIHRDFRDFKHEYLFNEIITNMPLRGKKTKQEMDNFYAEFFEKAKSILTNDAVIVMYTNEIGFVKKQLRLQKEFSLQQETCLQPKNDFYLLIIKYKG